MNVEDVREVLVENKINTSVCLINPPICREGALCLREEPNGEWTVTLNERGEFLINESFRSENDACRYFLRTVLSDPTYRTDFKQSDLNTYDALAKERDDILRKYNL